MFLHVLFVDDSKRDTCINIQLSSVEKSMVQVAHHSQHVPMTCPKSLRQYNSLEPLDKPRAICHDEHHVYCSLLGSNNMLRIDAQGNKLEWVSYSTGTTLESIRIKDNKIFVILSKNENRKICVHGLQGQLIRSWQHADCSVYNLRNKLAVIGNQVIVCNVGNKRLNVYSLTGDIIRYIPCTQLSYDSSMCEAGDDSVAIITSEHSDRVYKLSLTTGQIEWTSTDMGRSAAVVCYADQYVLVAAINSSVIIVLDMNTGRVLGEMLSQIASLFLK